MSQIAVFFNQKCLLHYPPYEVLSGHITQWFESPDRVKHIKAHLEKFPKIFPITISTKDYGLDPILAIHDPEYIEYLRTIFPEWVKWGGNPKAGVVPEMMLQKNLLPANSQPNMDHPIGKVGMYHFDLSSTVTADTWTSAYAAVQTALTATEAALNLRSSPLVNGKVDGKSKTVATFALIRPPGHHATTNLCGGYCYLNNVVICASYSLRKNSRLKCVIVDVDFHHGNGVEEILQRNRTGTDPQDWRDRCRYISLHAHPDYPYYTTHLPTPVPKTVTSEEYIRHLRRNLESGQDWYNDETLVLVSLGLDTLSSDPIGGLDGFTSQQDYVRVGIEIGRFVRRIKGKGCFLLEGGYVVEKLGECVEGVLRGYMRGLVVK